MSCQAFLVSVLIAAIASQKQTATASPKKIPRSYNIKSNQKEIKKGSLFLDVVPQTNEELRHSNFALDIIHTIAVNPTDRIEYDFSVDPDHGKFIWISYFLKDEGDYEFIIMDRETNGVLHSVSGPHQFMAKLFFRRKEELRFIFRNKGSNTFIRIFVGLECHGCHPLKSLAGRDDVKQSVKSIKSIDNSRSTMYFMTEMYAERQKQFLNQLKKNHSRIFLFGVFELVVIVLINVYQVVAIRGMLKRRTLV